jgi:hypothetical protein
LRGDGSAERFGPERLTVEGLTEARKGRREEKVFSSAISAIWAVILVPLAPLVLKVF